MQLKSSKKFPLWFVLILVFLVVLLLSLSSNRKVEKYPKTPDFEQKTSFDLIQITFNEKSFKKIEKKRLEALATGILETRDSDYVPATISFNGEDFRAEVRLKGDWTDHLKGEKWSFRVKLKNDKTILGMRKFSIHHPQTRGHHYLAEWLYLKAVKREKLLGLRYNFLEGAIHIKSNNSSKYVSRDVGLYAMEETFDKRTLESNAAKESVILKFSEDVWWNEVKKSIKAGSSLGYSWEDFMNHSIVERAKFPILPFSEEKTILDSTMNGYFKLSKGLLESVYIGNTTIDEVFDVKKLAMQNAILNLFGAVHGTYIINLRFYYNPITSLLEPIAFDGNSGNKLVKYTHFMFVNKEKDSVYLKELAYALEKVSNPEYLRGLISEYKEESEKLEKTLIKEFYSKGLSIENLEFNQEIMRTELMSLKNRFGIENITLETNSIAKDIIVQSAVVERIEVPDAANWINNNTILSKTKITSDNRDIYNLSRDDASTNSYTVTPNIKVNPGRVYKTSILVKKGRRDAYFGLRIQGDYPNRVDAVFDLENGQVKKKSLGGNFENVNATIKSISKDWFLCSLEGKIMTSNVKIILGPTTEQKNSEDWEGVTNKNCDVYILPSSLLVEEISK